ncbi:MAG: ribonuclease III [Desulfobacterium sp.]|nr:ribonuclease III [Desulfobacterium sp.]MBU3946821.1 ribonuclease III [Pseudomonadota bacterium]MBU4037304.1 ribonuclease III [Pseudomonadota bacterium]
MERAELLELREKLSYKFKDINLLEEALRHSSFVNEQSGTQLRDNERLEFLGDAVLNLVIGHIIINRFPELDEGDLSRVRSNLVNELQVAEVARSLDLGSYLQLGKGEFLTNGRNKNSILANTFEAVVAAIYLDGGYDNAFRIIEMIYLPILKISGKSAAAYDFKSKIQELVQTGQEVKPIYNVIEESGPDHDKMFKVALMVNDIQTVGYGKSKKIAEQDAAREAFDILTNKSESSADAQ